MKVRKFDEYFESKNSKELVSLKSLAPIIHAMRENNVEEAKELIKKFEPASGLFIRDEYLIDLASDFNMREIFDILHDRKKEIKK